MPDGLHWPSSPHPLLLSLRLFAHHSLIRTSKTFKFPLSIYYDLWIRKDPSKTNQLPIFFWLAKTHFSPPDSEILVSPCLKTKLYLCHSVI